jgi:uncharacterized protein YeaO (DUF488 family)
MSRHTLQDGTTPDTRITDQDYDLWLPIFAPRPSDVGKYYRDELDWEAYVERYKNYLSTIPEAVDALARWAIYETVTIMCIEDTPEQCHRRLLAEHCQQRHSDLEIHIK